MKNKQLWDIVNAIRDKTPRGWILMSSNSIGEVLIICSLARSMIEKYGYPITLCVRPDHVRLVETLYPGRFTAVVPMDQALMRSFSESGYVTGEHFDIEFPIHLSPLHHYDGLLWRLHNLLFKREGGSGLNVTDVFRCLLRLDWDAPVEKPCLDFFKKENSVVASLGVKVEDKAHVLLQPGNNTNKPLPASFWGFLERKLAEENSQIFSNVKGAMLIDHSLKFKASTPIKLDIVDALYLAYHSKSIVSVLNGLVNSAIFLDYPDSNPPLVHGINTDKYCAHYHLLGKDWDAAFVEFEGAPSTWLGGNESISESSKFCEWQIGTSLTEKEYEAAASSIFEFDRESPHYICSHLEGYRFKFPAPYTFG